MKTTNMEFRHVLLLAVGLLCASLCESRHTRGGGRRRGDRRPPGQGRGDRRPPGPGGNHPGKVLACSTTPGDEPLDCGDSSECTAGPLSVVFNGDDVSVTFCDTPFKPKKEDVCKVTDAEGNEINVCHELKECADGESCIVGPIPHRRRDEERNLYICGTQNVIPDVDYADLVKQRACGVGDDLDNDACGDEGSCTGPEVTVGDVKLTFCVKDDVEDDDRTLLDLFNHSKKQKRRDEDDEEEEEKDEDEDEDDECEDIGRQGPGRGNGGRQGRGRGGPRQESQSEERRDRGGRRNR